MSVEELGLAKQSSTENVILPSSFELTLGRNLGPTLNAFNSPLGNFGNHAFKKD